MSLPVLGVVVLALLWAGYRFYGGFVARRFSLRADEVTPATRLEDGVDYVPTKPFYLTGQHFAAISAAGPIAGPILAGQQFGWLPCLLWIGLGVVFIGAVHDMSTLVASVRHDGRSIADVVRAYMGPRSALALSVFIWIALVYVIVAFADITAQAFVSSDRELAGMATPYNPGGAVALASISYLGLSVVMGLLQRFLKPPLWLLTIVFVPATLFLVWLGTQHSTLLAFEDSHATWAMLIMVYCFVASLTPVWALLQPRGYLGGFVLYMALAAGVIGIFLGGFSVELPAFKGFSAPGEAGLLFPFLFVTIACGACSGFHGLVCSGTTSKQIESETHCHPVGYGAMLLEGFVAVIALATLMIAAPAAIEGRGPGAIYGEGLGRFLTVIIGEGNLAFATTFGAMAFSTFIFDTLDVSTRLGRYLLQELFGWKGRFGAIAATFLTAAVPAGIVLLSGTNAYRLFWTLFGTSNQLLAALSLLGVTIWLKHSGRRFGFTLLPMLFVLAITMTALVLQIAAAFEPDAGAVALINGVVGVVLFVLAAWLTTDGARRLLSR